jgi:hypothetical protein
MESVVPETYLDVATHLVDVLDFFLLVGADENFIAAQHYVGGRTWRT